MTLPPLLLALALLRLGELALAARNTRRLRARGGIEAAPGHYPWLVALHLSWFAALAAAIPPGRPGHPWGLGLFAGLLATRLWVIASLGPFWTTRIITLPGQPLVRRGPYRLLRHPNYLVVAGELAVLPAAFGAWRLALGFTLANGLLTGWRIRRENAALAPRRHLPPASSLSPAGPPMLSSADEPISPSPGGGHRRRRLAE